MNRRTDVLEYKGLCRLCETDVRFLVERLREDLEIWATIGRTHRLGQYIVNVHRRDEAMKIKDLVSPLLPECCQYKLRKVRPTLKKAEQ